VLATPKHEKENTNVCLHVNY